MRSWYRFTVWRAGPGSGRAVPNLYVLAGRAGSVHGPQPPDPYSARRLKRSRRVLNRPVFRRFRAVKKTVRGMPVRSVWPEWPPLAIVRGNNAVLDISLKFVRIILTEFYTLMILVILIRLDDVCLKQSGCKNPRFYIPFCHIWE